MIIDSHSHAWQYWPYDPPVPDHESRGNAEQLLWEMDRNGVDQSVLVCARIEHNPDNNDYVAARVKEHPDRLVQFADVDCSWSATYHTPGGTERLAEAADPVGGRVAPQVPPPHGARAAVGVAPPHRPPRPQHTGGFAIEIFRQIQGSCRDLAVDGVNGAIGRAPQGNDQYVEAAPLQRQDFLRDESFR